MAKCELCGKEIQGEVFRWERYRALCWPCKKPLLDANLKDAVRRVKEHFERPEVNAHIAKVLGLDEEK